MMTEPSIRLSCEDRAALKGLVAGRNMLGLPLGTLVTGTLFVALLVMWKEPAASKLVHADT